MPPKTKDEAAALDALVAEAYRRTGVTLDEGKRNMLSNRLRRRCRAVGVGSLREYWKLLKTLDDAADEVAEFIHSVTTHKTSLFRTSSVWAFLKEELTRLAESQGRVSAWSAACSSGQEAASLTMLSESLAAGDSPLRYSVLASDVSAPVVQKASEANFSVDEVNAAIEAQPGIPVDSYFGKVKEDKRALLPTLRRNVEYQTHNLFEPISRSFDVILLRNVIIYFTEEDRRRVIQNCCSALKSGGVLVIGESESLHGDFQGLEYIAPCTYRKTK